MKLGITGSRNGLSDDQLRVLNALVHRSAFAEGTYHEITEVHYGDCVGADQQAAEAFIEVGLGATLHCHPATMNPEWDAKWRANTAAKNPGEGIVMYPAKDPLARNDDIVAACDVLWAFPSSMDGKGGTWYTIRKAIDQGTFVRIIGPTITNAKEPM